MELVLVFLLFLAIIIFFGTAAVASFRAAPWLPMRSVDFDRVLKQCNGRTGQFAEFGAGDGRLLIQIAKHTELTGVGYEISMIPFCAAKIRLRTAKVVKKANVVFKDFYYADLRPVRTIFCFLTPPAMAKLKVKFEKEAQPGTRIISYSFSIPGWTPTHVDREGSGIPIWVYDR